MMKKKVAIVGAGFSGLTLAWVLTKNNIPVEVFEASGKEGGLLGSKFDGVLIEQAANALLASENVELLLQDIGVKPVESGYRSKSRWIFRGLPRKLPISVTALIAGVLKFLYAKITGAHLPRINESLAQWSDRVLNKSFTEYLVSAAFQGIYATTADKLSASLILRPLFDKKLKTKKGNLRGSITAMGGMQEIVDALTSKLIKAGVTIHKNTNAEVAELQPDFAAVVMATSLHSAKSGLLKSAPKTAAKISKVPALSISGVTLKFSETKRIQGFGCLFPKSENFNSLGVLFNSDTFPNRGDFSERWIITDVTSSDTELLNSIKQDRLKLVGADEPIESSFINRWKMALPLYGPELEMLLAESDFSEGLLNGIRLSESRYPLYLTGNYLGVIGLAKILDYNIRLGHRISKELF